MVKKRSGERKIEGGVNKNSPREGIIKKLVRKQLKLQINISLLLLFLWNPIPIL